LKNQKEKEKKFTKWSQTKSIYAEGREKPGKTDKKQAINFTP